MRQAGAEQRRQPLWTGGRRENRIRGLTRRDWIQLKRHYERAIDKSFGTDFSGCGRGQHFPERITRGVGAQIRTIDDRRPHPEGDHRGLGTPLGPGGRARYAEPVKEGRLAIVGAREPGSAKYQRGGELDRERPRDRHVGTRAHEL